MTTFMEYLLKTRYRTGTCVNFKFIKDMPINENCSMVTSYTVKQIMETYVYLLFKPSFSFIVPGVYL